MPCAVHHRRAAREKDETIRRTVGALPRKYRDAIVGYEFSEMDVSRSWWAPGRSWMPGLALITRIQSSRFRNPFDRSAVEPSPVTSRYLLAGAEVRAARRVAWLAPLQSATKLTVST